MKTEKDDLQKKVAVRISRQAKPEILKSNFSLYHIVDRHYKYCSCNIAYRCFHFFGNLAQLLLEFRIQSDADVCSLILHHRHPPA